MRIFKKVILSVAVLLVALATLVFVLENRQSVSMNFFGWSAPDLPLALPVVLALLLGMLIGPVFAWIASLRKRRTSTARSV
ncbi:Uncharacterized protein ABJ99_1942 [Pseudomonas syringae pv. cilantro]|uniref:Lipopolysaccharide assembly protein A domain-containing protein n=2 Tax=Pseudomonas syringae group TaxID=136849 RepID=A0A0N0GG38_PSESX|nr:MULTISPECIES: lipopolysaccharide assembly protein LapA domain-containing protein [Pseudomonas syringae group]KPC33089.1 Uncharacterized protein ABJ99_1942 [Pseudomonas syringae pv. cilantro]KPW77981.1 Uncharacterized protein ALO76_03733 [Pseudomonas syringae pv. coriandricola]RMN07669.1 hypothetical protein ALQ65_01399 [Pseudomonas syringae pv. coriandricola]